MCREVAAIWVAPEARKWLGGSTAVSILHVFGRACNLINGDGKILSLVTAELGPGPFAVVIPFSQPFTQFVTVETAVSIANNTITLGSLAIDTANAALWPPSPPWESLHQQTNRLSALRQMGHRLVLSNAEGLTQMNTDWAAVGRQRSAVATHTLLKGIAAHDPDACRAGAHALAGLGPGLTPAGDDFLMGAIYGLWATRPADEVRVWAKVMVETAVSRTTSLSAAWLRAAARGEASQSWHELVNGMVRGDETAVATAVRHILATGHTSGADALAGFTAVLSYMSS